MPVQRRSMAHPKAVDRVKAGAKFLDKRIPNWFLKIDPGNLLQKSVLEQLYGSYWTAAGKHKITDQGAQQMGFATISFESDSTKIEKALLADCWQKEVENRLQASRGSGECPDCSAKSPVQRSDAESLLVLTNNQ